MSGGPFSELVSRSLRISMPLSAGLMAIYIITQLVAAYAGVVAVVLVCAGSWALYRQRER